MDLILEVMDEFFEIEEAEQIRQELVNAAGGVAYAIKDPSTLMLTMIGVSFLNETAYYPAGFKYQEMQKTGSIFSPVYKSDIKERVNVETFNSLEDRTRLLLMTAWNIADSKTPQDLLKLANWSRNEMNIRTTPQWLLAIAAEHPATKPFVREYCRKIIQRPDEIKDVVAAYMFLFGTRTVMLNDENGEVLLDNNGSPVVATKGKGLPNSLKRGLADAMSSISEYGFMKYNNQDHPRFADVLNLIDRKKGWPIKNQSLLKWVYDGTLDENAERDIPSIYAAKELSKMSEFSPRAIELAKKCNSTWEMLSSQFGGNEKDKKEVWELCAEIMTGKTSLEQGKRPRTNFMAVLRNIRNFAKAEISDAHWSMVIKLISNKEEVLSSRQLPFRYLSSFNIIRTDPSVAESLNSRANGEIKKSLLKALEKAIEYSAENLAKLPGTTVLATDQSGSMDSIISEKTRMTRKVVGNLLSSMANIICDDAIAIAWGTDYERFDLDPSDGIFKNMQKLSNANVGWSTEGWKVVDYLIKNRISVDRVIFFTDMQLYSFEKPMMNLRQIDPSLNSKWKLYKKRINPKAWIHVVDLAGYGEAAINIDENNKAQIISGFSEKVLNRVVESEGYIESIIGIDEEDEEKAKQISVPTMEYIRENF